tara:strand:- start:168 stop:1244 length:1077 start_codon:yes stop_codon:yes gene_type:complete
MEKEAYLQGNMCFRDWEDGLSDEDTKKYKIVESKFLKENKTMTTKITKEFLKETIKKVLKEYGDDLDVSATAAANTDLVAAAKSSMKLHGASVGLRSVMATVKGLLKLNTDEADETAKDYVAMVLPKTRNIDARLALDGLSKKADAQIAARTQPEPESKFARGLKAAQKIGGVTGTVKEGELEEGGASGAAPGHYCIHHGGVQHEGKIVAAEAVQHVEPDENGFISHYDMMLEDGTVLEDIAASDIQVTNASLAEGHHGRRSDGHKPMKPKKKTQMEENEDLEEAKKKKKKAKPDFADIDGDGNRKESMKKAAKDKKKKKKTDESKIQTPEQENTLYESRFTPKNNRLFDKLLKEWTK